MSENASIGLLFMITSFLIVHLSSSTTEKLTSIESILKEQKPDVYYIKTLENKTNTLIAQVNELAEKNKKMEEINKELEEKIALKEKVANDVWANFNILQWMFGAVVGFLIGRFVTKNAKEKKVEG